MAAAAEGDHVMSEELLKLLEERDALGERPKLRASSVPNGPIAQSNMTQFNSTSQAPVLNRSYWSPTPDPLMFDNTRSKTDQARSGTGYMEVLSTTVTDGHDLYDTVLNFGQKTRLY